MSQENRRGEPPSPRENRREPPERRRDDDGNGCFRTIWDVLTFSWLFNLFGDDD